MPRERTVTIGGVARAMGVVESDSIAEVYQQAMVEHRTRVLTASLVEALPHAVWGIDRGGRVEIANGAARRLTSVLLQIAADGSVVAVGNRPFSELAIASDPQAWNLVVNEGQVAYELTSHLSVIDGTARLAVTAVDVTRERAMLARLADAERRAAVGVLGAGVAHEINNPLGFVLSNVRSLGEYLHELARLAGAAPEAMNIMADAPQLLDETERGLSRIAHIVKELLHFSVRGGGEEPPRQVTLPEIVDQALRLCGHELRSRGTLERWDAPAAPILGQVRQLGDVAIDLLVNAFDAVASLPSDRRLVWVRTFTEGQWAVLEIVDRGVGIPAEVLPHVFEPFFTTKGRARGTGLGLSVASEIVRRHGGELTIASQVGAGTLVRVQLPARTPAPSGSPGR